MTRARGCSCSAHTWHTVAAIGRPNGLLAQTEKGLLESCNCVCLPNDEGSRLQLLSAYLAHGGGNRAPKWAASSEKALLESCNCVCLPNDEGSRLQLLTAYLAHGGRSGAQMGC